MRCSGLLSVSMLLAMAAELPADYFVAQNGQTPEPPYTNPAGAASNIQDAVNIAGNGGVVWVDAGRYLVPHAPFTFSGSTNVVGITNALALRSLHGPAATIIDGGGSNRCLYLQLPADACAFGPALVDGFTLTNGYAIYTGGGVFLNGVVEGTAIVQNCVIAGNVLQKESAGTSDGGGGIYCYSSVFYPVISNCIVRGNRTIAGSQGAASGGGAYLRSKCQVTDCTFESNTACAHGGGSYLASAAGALIDRCALRGNSAATNGGGVYIFTGGEMRNTLITGNNGTSGGGVYANYAINMYNCTVISNATATQVYVSKNTANGAMHNNIVDSLNVQAGASVTGYNNCLPSLPANGEWHNTLVTTNNPAYVGFIQAAEGNFRLRRDSPCVNAGTGQMDWLPAARDLDGRRRRDMISGLPDIGCYEYIPDGTFFKCR